MYYVRFPKDPELKKKWLSALQMEHYKAPPTAVVCSDHFTPGDFKEHTSFKRCLRKEAIPSVTETSLYLLNKTNSGSSKTGNTKSYFYIMAKYLPVVLKTNNNVKKTYIFSFK